MNFLSQRKSLNLVLPEFMHKLLNCHMQEKDGESSFITLLEDRIIYSMLTSRRRYRATQRMLMRKEVNLRDLRV